MHKIIADVYYLKRGKVEYLKERAIQCLKNMETADHDEKVRQWQMFLTYNDLYEANKHRACPEWRLEKK